MHGACGQSTTGAESSAATVDAAANPYDAAVYDALAVRKVVDQEIDAVAALQGVLVERSTPQPASEPRCP